MFGKKVDFKKLNEVIFLSSKILKVLYLLLIAISIYVILVIFRETKFFVVVKTLFKVVSPLFIGILIAWLFDPFVKWLEDRRIKRVFGATITYLCMFLCLFLVLYSLIPLLVNQGQEFIKMIPKVFLTVKGWAGDMFDYVEKLGIDSSKFETDFLKYINDFAYDVTIKMPQNIFEMVSKLISYFGTFILGLIIGFFLLMTFDSTFKIYSIIPNKHVKTTSEIVDKVNNSLRSYVRGAVIDCLIIFILSSIGLWIAGLKAPLLFGLFCGITNIIPYAGPYIGGAPAVAFGFTQSPIVGIFCLIVIFVIQFLEGNFLQPLIMSRTTKLHPVTIILGLLVFGHFFGIVGMLISTPVIAALKTVFKYYDDKYKLLNKTSHEE